MINKLIEPLLPVYQSVIKLPMVILDGQANVLYKSAEVHVTDYQTTLRNVLEEYKGFNATVMIESPFSKPEGTKYVIVCLAHDHYLLAGPYVSPECDNHDFPTLTDVEVGVAREKLADVRQVLQRLDHEKQQALHTIFSLVKQLATSDSSSELIERDLLYERMVHDFSDLNFAGLAKPTEDGTFTVTTFYSTEEIPFENYSFSLGQGFLGQAAISKSFKVWPKIENDMRNMYMKQYGLHPAAIFGYPVMRNDQCVAVIFGGSTFFSEISSETFFVLQNTFDIISQNLKIEALEEKLYNVNTRLHVLKDIFAIISNMKDLRQTAYVLIDMTLVLVKSKFSSVFVHQQEHATSPQLFARGLSQNLIEDYTQSIKQRYLAEDKATVNMEPQKWQTSWQAFVYEFPLVRNDRFIGLLSIHLPDQHTDQQIIDLLTSIGQVGAVTIDLIMQEQHVTASNRISNLFAAVEDLNPKQFAHQQKTLTAIDDFSLLVDADQDIIQLCKDVCMLAAYSERFIQKHQFGEKIAEVLSYYKQLKLGNHQLNKKIPWASQFLYVVDHYVEHQQFPDPMTDVQKDLLLRLSTFSFRQSLEVGRASDTNVKKEPLDLTIMKKRFNLSKRELEVLEHVIAGIHNTEIATTLFISEHTVKNHITNIFRKLEVRDRSQAIAKSYKVCLEQ